MPFAVGGVTSEGAHNVGCPLQLGEPSEGAQVQHTAFVSDNVVAAKLSAPFAHEALVASTTHQLHQHLVLEAILQL